MFKQNLRSLADGILNDFQMNIKFCHLFDRSFISNKWRYSISPVSPECQPSNSDSKKINMEMM